MCARVTLLGQPMLLLSSRVASTRVSHFEAVRPSTGDTFRCIPPPLYLLASDIRSLFTVVHGCKILRYCILKVFPIIAEIKKEDLLSSSSLRNIFFYTFSLSLSPLLLLLHLLFPPPPSNSFLATNPGRVFT